MTPDSPPRKELIETIVELESECRAMRGRIVDRKKHAGRIKWLGQKIAVRGLLGMGLSRSLSRFLSVAGTDQSRILGPELAQTLDAATGRMIGRKRTLTIIALIAASPAILSLWLLINGWQITKEQKEDAAFTAQLMERANWLSIIYTQQESSISGRSNTPVYSIRGRREAVLALMEHDLQRLEEIPTDFWGNVSRVNIDAAPLFGINLTSIRGEAPIVIERVSFRGSSLRAANFSGTTVMESRFNEGFLNDADLTGATFASCLFLGSHLENTNASGAVFRDCDFSQAVLRGTNFEGASFEGDCVLDKALYDSSVKWPAGFDPQKAGAIPIPEARRGGRAE